MSNKLIQGVEVTIMVYNGLWSLYSLRVRNMDVVRECDRLIAANGTLEQLIDLIANKIGYPGLEHRLIWLQAHSDWHEIDFTPVAGFNSCRSAQRTWIYDLSRQ